MVLRMVALIAISALQACAVNVEPDESSSFYSVPPTSRLVLDHQLTIPPGKVSVLLQYGEIKHEHAIEHYSPWCKFELYSIADNERVVQPDTFRVLSVLNEVEDVSIARQQYASLRMAHEAPSVFTYTTVMMLHSEGQPDVFRMSCMHWEDIMDDRFLSIDQIRGALGDIFTLELPHS